MTDAELKEFIVREIARAVDAYLAPLRENQKQILRVMEQMLLENAAFRRQLGIEEGEEIEPSYRN